MKSKLFIYNYGLSEVATFKTMHDSFICLKAMNELLIKAYGSLPENIFYFTIDKKNNTTVFYDTNFNWDVADQRRAVIKELYYNKYENVYLHNSKKLI